MSDVTYLDPKHPSETRLYRAHFGAQPELALYGDQLSGTPSVTVAPDTSFTGTVTAGTPTAVGTVSVLTLTAPGASGTPGEYAINFSGGGSTAFGASGTFVVGSNGLVASVALTSGGRGYTSAPTLDLSSCPGLTGATATATIQLNEAWFTLAGGTDLNDYVVTVTSSTAGGSTLVAVAVLPVRAKL